VLVIAFSLFIVETDQAFATPAEIKPVLVAML
jgi:hypothetical protein